jgi:hypothetical protein
LAISLVTSLSSHKKILNIFLFSLYSNLLIFYVIFEASEEIQFKLWLLSHLNSSPPLLGCFYK